MFFNLYGDVYVDKKVLRGMHEERRDFLTERHKTEEHQQLQNSIFLSKSQHLIFTKG